MSTSRLRCLLPTDSGPERLSSGILLAKLKELPDAKLTNLLETPSPMLTMTKATGTLRSAGGSTWSAFSLCPQLLAAAPSNLLKKVTTKLDANWSTSLSNLCSALSLFGSHLPPTILSATNKRSSMPTENSMNALLTIWQSTTPYFKS